MEKLLFTVSWLGGWFMFLLGDWHVSLTVLFIFLIIGGVTAFFKAIIIREINSHDAYKKIIKKIGIVLAIVVANLLDILTGSEFLFRNMAIFFFVGLIGLEIIENFIIMGVPIPEPITKYLSQLTNKENDENE